MASSTSFLDAMAIRRSVYSLKNTSPVSQERISEIVHEAVKYCPSAFNIRSTRCIILFGSSHTALWDHAAEVTPASASKEVYDLLVPRIGLFRAAYGTILFFDDPTTISNVPAPFHPFFTQYPEIHDHAAGMLQFAVWTALAAEGLGCNLQHYQPMITPWVEKTFDVPAHWKLTAQLVFGEMVDGPGPEKERTGLGEAIRVFGDKKED
ncbi:Nitroreductase-like protein [Paraphoma chrysanthemicola]|uniref:Nitroreductase-like protein n=1 Tax=Paraphoma chrysanthemicola TaxID=798071 RepID=A0A8K0QZ43_9PLEO|nr:Nitroreductase-like protein [Paraphoma chrysanthemicola]